ncbi:MAG: ComF family protein [Ignavibacteria bacterium]|nr:ComF family protein [Ignavibacteria bacterium]
MQKKKEDSRYRQFNLLTGTIKGLKDNIIDFIYPKICIVTGELLEINNSNPYISDNTVNNIQRASRETYLKFTENISANYTFSLYNYYEDSDSQKIIHHLKYKGLKKIGVHLGMMIYDALIQEKFDFIKKFDLIIPVPLHKAKVRERGYNQSEYISRGLSEKTGIHIYCKLIFRIKNTKSQTKLTIEEREKNVKGAFRINPNYKNFITGKKIILVDDVITTGSTVKEIIKELRKDNPEEIFFVSACIAASDL